jgi:hypothetical protein
MRLVKEENVEIVYSAMKSHYENTQNWKMPLSVKEIVEIVYSAMKSNARKKGLSAKEIENLPKMDRRCIYRHLDTLMKEKPPRVIKIGRGQYTVDFAAEQINNQRKAFTRIMLSVDSHRKLRGENYRMIDGQKFDVPTNPIFGSPEEHKVFMHIEDWRLKIHNQKDIADAEANAWTNSFIDVLSYDVETGEAPLKIRPESLVTTEKKVGVNAFIFRKAMEIMLELLESLDTQSLKNEKSPIYLGDTQLMVRITFNPVDFYNVLKSYRDRFEMELNRHEVQAPSGLSGRKFQLNDTIEKHVFHEIFGDQPNKYFDRKYGELSNIKLRNALSELPNTINDQPEESNSTGKKERKFFKHVENSG